MIGASALSKRRSAAHYATAWLGLDFVGAASRDRMNSKAGSRFAVAHHLGCCERTLTRPGSIVTM
jgi:hypothetical protein